MAPKAIEALGVTRRYGEIQAVGGVDLDVEQARVGFLPANRTAARSDVARGPPGGLDHRGRANSGGNDTETIGRGHPARCLGPGGLGGEWDLAVERRGLEDVYLDLLTNLNNTEETSS